MPRRAWRFITLLLAALSMALSFCHLMELAPRLRLAPQLWIDVTVHGGQYALFGSVGAVIDVGAVVAVILLAFRERHGASARPAAIAAALFVVAHASWWGFVFPMNQILAGWLHGAATTDFTAVRAQWEYAHAGIALLKVGGFLALMAAVLPGEGPVPADE